MSQEERKEGDLAIFALYISQCLCEKRSAALIHEYHDNTLWVALG